MKALIPLATLVAASSLLAPPTWITRHLAPTDRAVNGTTIFVADTLVPVKPDPLLPKPLSKPNLNLLTKNGNGATLKYVAIGGKLAAGYRDGGLYRQGQLTAYPNLMIANQWGLPISRRPYLLPRRETGRAIWHPKRAHTTPTGSAWTIKKAHAPEMAVWASAFCNFIISRCWVLGC